MEAVGDRSSFCHVRRVNSSILEHSRASSLSYAIEAPGVALHLLSSIHVLPKHSLSLDETAVFVVILHQKSRTKVQALIYMLGAEFLR